MSSVVCRSRVVEDSALTHETGGIGPQDQLEIVQGSALDGETMISSEEWIELPVGYNLEDHTNVSGLPKPPQCSASC